MSGSGCKVRWCLWCRIISTLGHLPRGQHKNTRCTIQAKVCGHLSIIPIINVLTAISWFRRSVCPLLILALPSLSYFYRHPAVLPPVQRWPNQPLPTGNHGFSDHPASLTPSVFHLFHVFTFCTMSGGFLLINLYSVLILTRSWSYDALLLPYAQVGALPPLSSLLYNLTSGLWQHFGRANLIRRSVVFMWVIYYPS